MRTRALRALLLVTITFAFGCVQRAILLPVVKPALTVVSHMTASSAAALATTAGDPAADASAPAGEDLQRFNIRAADSHLELKIGDVWNGRKAGLWFESWHGSFFVDPASPAERPAGKLVIDIDASTLQVYRQGIVIVFVLRREFLEVDRYPRARIVATVRPRTDDAEGHVIQGRILLHGVERAIRFHGQVRREHEDYRIKAVFDMSRKEFDIRHYDFWDVAIYDDFRVELDLIAHAEHVSAEVLEP